MRAVIIAAMNAKLLKDKMLKGDAVYGTMIQNLTNPAIVDFLPDGVIDFVIVSAEHNALDLADFLPLRYALAHRGTPVHVDLLFVAEPAARLEVLRFRTQAEMAEWQAKMAQWLLEDAAKPLQEAGLSVYSHFREGDIANEIVETAERLGADAIVMPPPHPVWLNFLTRGIVRKVLRRARATPVVHVDREGRPLAASATRIAAQSI